MEILCFSRIDEHLDKYLAYPEVKAVNGGMDPFRPAAQPHFEWDFVSLFIEGEVTPEQLERAGLAKN